MVDSIAVTSANAVAVRTVLERWLTSAQPAVIFDFNGTLSDDEPILFDIFRDLFATHLDWAMTEREYREHLLGRSDREIVEHAVTRHGGGGDRMVDHLLRLRRGRYQQRVADTSPIAAATLGLVTVLAGHGIPLGIVTGAQREDVLAVLANSPAGGHFPVLVAAEDVTHGKPDPEGFLAAARLMRRRPSDLLVFEDSVPGVRGALAARMHCIAVSAAPPDPDLLAAAPALVTELSADLVAAALSARSRQPE